MIQASSHILSGRLSQVNPDLNQAIYLDLRLMSTGFDESFNAITGLNGSGKSNILDAICFVLGITNMTSVSHLAPRLEGMYELIT